MDKQIQTLYQSPSKYGYGAVDLTVSAIAENGTVLYASLGVGHDVKEEVPSIVKFFKSGEKAVEDGYLLDWNDPQFQWYPKYLFDQMIGGAELRPIAEYGENAVLPPKTKAEHIPQQQDISHKTNNDAELSAARTNANGQKGSNIMADWTPKTNKQEQEKALAYIHKDTREAAKANPTIAALADAMLESAKEQMDAIAKAGLTTKSKTRDGNTTYTDKMVVKVEPAERYNKETKENELIIDADGNQVFRPTIEYSHAGTTLTEFGKNKLDEAGKAVIGSMNAHKWTRTNGKADINRFKQDEIASAPINKDVKAIAAFIEQNGFVTEITKGNPLRDFSVEANKQFSEANNVVLNTNGEYVNDAYAKYVNDSYGERVEIHNHSDNTLVELGVTAEGKNYARATNFDLNESFDPRADGEQPAKVYINSADDVAKYIALPEIQDAVSAFKGFDGKEQSAKKDKSSIERD